MRSFLIIYFLFFTSLLTMGQSDDFKLQIPNIITPNGDGINDRFEIKDANNETFTLDSAPYLLIVSRYGKTIFEATRYINQWDASNLTEGEYFYVLKFEGGDSFSGSISIRK